MHRQSASQTNEAVVFNACVPSFGEGAKDRPQGDGVGEGESGYASTEGAEGGSLCAGECAPDSCSFEYGLPLQGVFRKGAPRFAEGALE